MRTRNIKLNVLGDITRLDKSLQKSIEKIMTKTKENTGLTLNIAFNYGGRDEIVRAVKKIAQEVKDNEISVENINEDVFSNSLYTAGQPDPEEDLNEAIHTFTQRNRKFGGK